MYLCIYEEFMDSSYIKVKLRKLNGKASNWNGIRTDEVIVENYVKKLIEFMMSDPLYVRQFGQMKSPFGPKVEELLKNRTIV
jgi:hypothetical protein